MKVFRIGGFRNEGDSKPAHEFYVVAEDEESAVEIVRDDGDDGFPVLRALASVSAAADMAPRVIGQGPAA